MSCSNAGPCSHADCPSDVNARVVHFHQYLGKEKSDIFTSYRMREMINPEDLLSTRRFQKHPVITVDAWQRLKPFIDSR